MRHTQNADNEPHKIPYNGRDIWDKLYDYAEYPSLTIKKGGGWFDPIWSTISVLAVLIGFVLLLQVPYEAFPQEREEWTYEPLFSLEPFFRTVFLIIFFLVLGYAWGQAVITGPTKEFALYVHFYSFGFFAYSLGWSLYTSYTLGHWPSYLLFGLAVICFLYSLKCLSGHMSEVKVRDWKKINEVGPKDTGYLYNFLIIKKQCYAVRWESKLIGIPLLGIPLLILRQVTHPYNIYESKDSSYVSVYECKDSVTEAKYEQIRYRKREKER